MLSTAVPDVGTEIGQLNWKLVTLIATASAGKTCWHSPFLKHRYNVTVSYDDSGKNSYSRL